MANTDERKPQAKPKGKNPARKKATAKASQPAQRKSAAARAPQAKSPEAKAPEAKAPEAKAPQAKGTRGKASPAPAAKPAAVAETPAVLVNAVKPDEKLAEAGLVEQAVDSLERSLKAAMPAAAAVNSKLVDIAQTNMNAGMALARDLAGARTPMEAMRLGMTYWHENMGLLQTQAEELRTLSAKLMTTASEPIRDHVRRA